MGIENVYVEIVIRSLITFAIIFIITEILGPKQISQLTFFDYIVGITIGSIGGAMCMDNEIPYWYGLIALGIFAVMSLVIGIFNRKTIWGRRIFTGNPIFLITNGEIIDKGLKRAQFSINDLLRELRNQGYFNIADVQSAVFETNGKLSILPKTPKRPIIVEDMSLTPPSAGIIANVIIDGKILEGNLSAMDKDKNWLISELSSKGANVQDIILGTLDDNGALSLYFRNKNDERRTVFQ